MPDLPQPLAWALAGAGIAAPLLLLLRAAWRSSVRRSRLVFRFEQVCPLAGAEQVLYWRLVEALPECVVLPQVTFSRFLRPSVEGRDRRAQHRALQNRISQKTVDFLVCLQDFTVVGAIELDDSSHAWARDEQRDAILECARVPLVRLRVEKIPSVERLREIFTSDVDKLTS